MIFKSTLTHQSKVENEKEKLNSMEINIKDQIHSQGLNNFKFNKDETIDLVEEKEIEENYYGFQVYLPRPVVINDSHHFQSLVVSPPPAFYSHHLYNEEIKESEVNQFSILKPNDAEIKDEMIQKVNSKFITFSNFEMNQMIEHLQIPITIASEGLPPTPNSLKRSSDKFNNHIYKDNEDHQIPNAVNVK